MGKLGESTSEPFLFSLNLPDRCRMITCVLLMQSIYMVALSCALGEYANAAKVRCLPLHAGCTCIGCSAKGLCCLLLCPGVNIRFFKHANDPAEDPFDIVVWAWCC